MYLWIKTLHVLAVISWMAGLLYLPRLFVYHCDAEVGSVQSETFKIMERRLLRGIMNPAMIVAWASGLWMGTESGFFHAGWFKTKLVFVVLMTVTHIYFVVLQNRFFHDKNKNSQLFFRVINEVPTILMIFIVSMVIIKP